MIVALEFLERFIVSIHPLTPPEWSAFSAIWHPFEAKRKTILTAAGDVERYVYFVLQGLQRAYAITPDGRDVTLVFTYPPSFSGVADAFLLQQPSGYFLETLTPSAFLRASFADLDAVMQRHHAVERLIRLAVSQALAGVLARQIELQAESAEARLKALLQRSPHMLTLVPHKYLASYLGMDPTNFSKLLNTVKWT